MPLRFTETDKWREQWFLDMPAPQKLVYLFLNEHCDNAGFIDINPRMNAFLLNMTEQDYITAIQGLAPHYELSNDGCRLWLRNFLRDQKNYPINPSNKAHKQIIRSLEKNAANFSDKISLMIP